MPQHLHGVLQNYRQYIGDAWFLKRMQSEVESLRAEAAVFTLLADHGLSPKIHEDRSLGGVDFECDAGGAAFSVEVTVLRQAMLAARAGVRHDVLEPGTIDVPQVIALIRSRISAKGTNSQARLYAGPQVLAIVSEHYMASVFFEAAAPELLTGRSRFAFRIGPKGMLGEPFAITQTKDAAQIRTTTAGGIEVFRRKHALILLIALQESGCQVVAIENPDPIRRLPQRTFADIPTVRLQWPVQGKGLHSGWSHCDRPFSYQFGTSQHVPAADNCLPEALSIFRKARSFDQFR